MPGYWLDCPERTDKSKLLRSHSLERNQTPNIPLPVRFDCFQRWSEQEARFKKQHTFWDYARILLKHHSKRGKKTSGFVLQSNCGAFSIRVGHIPELRAWVISGARTVLTPAWTHQMKWTCSASWRRQSRHEWKLISGGYWACAAGSAISLTLGGSRDPFINERLHCHPLMHPIMECVCDRGMRRTCV